MIWLVACTGNAVDTAVEAPWNPPDQAGPYGVGKDTFEWTDARGKELVAELWYPAYTDGEEPDAYEPLTLTGVAVDRADPVTAYGAWPLVAFSHGAGAIRYQSIFLTEHLASHGYAVVAVDHPGNTMFDFDEELTLQATLERPGDVSASVDMVMDDPDYGPLVDGETFAVMGHSFGAFTSLVVGGGVWSFEGIPDACEQGYAESIVCNTMEGSEDVDPADWAGVDERAVVTVPMSPGVWYAFGADGSGLASVRKPLVLAGDADGTLSYEGEIRPVWEHMSDPKGLLTFAGAGHYAFSDICELASFITDECEEEAGGWPAMAPIQEVTRAYVTAYVGRTFLGDARYDDWLALDWTDVDVVLE